MSKNQKQLLWLAFFSVAMGFLEAAVVIYLRHLYYPGGFKFPLSMMPENILITELLREVATLIMLTGVAVLSGRSAYQRFAFFLIAFAVWDIFYYVFLYVLLAWPESLFTWDILFLIPVPWVGPVICPCLVSLAMIALMWSTIHWQAKGKSGKLNWKEGSVLLMGSAIVIVSFVCDYLEFVNAHPTGKSSFTLAHNKELFIEGATYIPTKFSWMMFWCGQVMLMGGVLLFHLRMRREKKVTLVISHLSVAKEEFAETKIVLSEN